MRAFGNDRSKRKGYEAFWNRDEVKRPLVGYSVKSWFPLEEYEASRKWSASSYLIPEVIDPEAFLNDTERLLREGETMDDDILRGVSPLQSVPWLCGTMGSKLKVLPGSVLAEDQALSWAVLDDIKLPRTSPWWKKYMEFVETLVRWSAGRVPVSHGTLVGPCDLHALVRGHTQSVLDLVEEPKRSRRLLHCMGEVFTAATEEVWQVVPQFFDGYFDAQYQLWAPGPIARMQEDASALYSPSLYRELLQDVDRRIARRFPYAFMHLHSTSMFLLDAFLEIEEIRCFEINYDVSGPPLSDMIGHFQRVQDASRSLLIRGSFTPDEVRFLMDNLDYRGLYLYIMVKAMQEVETLRPLVGM